MKTICIIGAGQIGSRHLQALALLKFKVKIFVFDVSNDTLQIAKQRYLEINQDDGMVEYTTDFSLMPKQVDIAIIATDANSRYEVINRLLESSKVKYIILEKMVFNDINCFEPTLQLFKKMKVSAYVNCTRRAQAIYQEIAKLLKGKKILFFEVHGNSINLGCNAIHYLDLFEFISEQKIVDLNIQFLNQGFSQSKRKGYLEFSGAILGCSNNGSQLLINDIDSQEERDAEIKIISEAGTIFVNETKKTAELLLKDNKWAKREVTFEIKFQSQLTDIVVEHLLSEGSCELTPFEDSINNHKILIEAFAEHLGQADKSKCLIT